MPCWLIKSDPSEYGWAQLAREKRTSWDGIRNYQARNNLQAMDAGDPCLFYHSGKSPGVVGVARVVRTAYPDPAAGDHRWVAVDVEAVRPLTQPVSLAALKADRRTSGMALIRQGRLSVCPVTEAEYQAVLDLGEG